MGAKAIKLLASFAMFLFFWQSNASANELPNLLDDLDPRDPNIEKILQYYDEQYIKETGESPFVDTGAFEKDSCFRNACPVWADVSKTEQMLYLYVNGSLAYIWPVSTGGPGHDTPDMDLNPNGRIYDKYSSTAYPGGDYNGLGNMPYAVFLKGGYAVHGTTQGNWPVLGKPASHGCVRVHPDNGFIFNRLTRVNGVGAVWVTIR